MYKELDKYLSGFFTVDGWYDDGFIIAQELLQEFDNNDWNELIKEILLKSIGWQTKYAYCIDKGINYEYALKSLNTNINLKSYISIFVALSRCKCK